METIKQVSSKLNDRILWFDGDSTIPSSNVDRFIATGNTKGLCVDEITKDIQQYNKFVEDEDRIVVKQHLNHIDTSFNIPEEYQQINIKRFLLNKLANEQLEDDQMLVRINRIHEELTLYKHFNLLPVLRTLIFVINTLQDKNVVWGIGRGSSVSSYILYLIGVHDVDSVLYELNIRDFLR